jgi:hypothetical protein
VPFRSANRKRPGKAKKQKPVVLLQKNLPWYSTDLLMRGRLLRTHAQINVTVQFHVVHRTEIAHFVYHAVAIRAATAGVRATKN